MWVLNRPQMGAGVGDALKSSDAYFSCSLFNSWLMLDVLRLGWSFWWVITRTVQLHRYGQVMQQETWVLGFKTNRQNWALLLRYKYSVFSSPLYIVFNFLFPSIVLMWDPDLDWYLLLVTNPTTLALLGLVSSWHRFCLSSCTYYICVKRLPFFPPMLVAIGSSIQLVNEKLFSCLSCPARCFFKDKVLICYVCFLWTEAHITFVFVLVRADLLLRFSMLFSSLVISLFFSSCCQY